MMKDEDVVDNALQFQELRKISKTVHGNTVVDASDSVGPTDSNQTSATRADKHNQFSDTASTTPENAGHVSLASVNISFAMIAMLLSYEELGKKTETVS